MKLSKTSKSGVSLTECFQNDMISPIWSMFTSPPAGLPLPMLAPLFRGSELADLSLRSRSYALLLLLGVGEQGGGLSVDQIRFPTKIRYSCSR